MSLPSGQIHFLLGGARSGKSTRAESLASAASSEFSAPVVYVATCATTIPLDSEMNCRLAAHRAQRPAKWLTIENRFDLDAIFAEHAGSVIIVDCLTLWLSWLLGLGQTEQQILESLDSALTAVGPNGIRLFLVSNELGMGLVPVGSGNRAYRDLVGRANQLAARYSSLVEFVVAGLPLRMK